jgi:predicted acyltransferase
MSIFGLCYWFIDVKSKQRFTDWGVAYGINAITVFFLSGVIARIFNMIRFSYGGDSYTLKGWIYDVVLSSIASPINASLLYAIMWIVLFYLLAAWMKKKNIIIKV